MNAGPRATDTWIPRSAKDWYDWLVTEERETVAAYCAKPSSLIAEYRREQDIARDYEGREILELLQNANDQAAERGERGRVLIELSQDGLIVANTGLAFSVGGVASLQTSHLSPKRRRRKQLIGNKGLGFRSVLNWSHTPVILSSALSLVYSQNHLREKLQALTVQYPMLAQVVMDERQAEDDVILPLLPFPLYSEDGDLAAWLVGEHAQGMFDRCKALLTEGYDTVVGMPFDMPRGHSAAQEQIREISPEILLFAQHLGELCFRCDAEPVVTWRCDGGDTLTKVMENDRPVGQWRIHRRTGKLPEDAIKADQSDATDYEIVVAVPCENTATKGILYSHFPTDITLPLPVVCHATLELEQNRKHAQQKRASNEYVLAKLAEVLADVAENVALSCPDVPWAGCSLLMPGGDYPEELIREKFPQKLTSCARSRTIIPTLSGNPVIADAARSVPGADPAWLPSQIFPEVVPIRNADDLRFLRSLAVSPLTTKDIKSRLIAQQDLTLGQRVALIAGLLQQPELRQVHTSALLLDGAENTLGDGVRVFLPPSGGEPPGLPEWADLRFLNQEMREKLVQQLGVREARELQQKLSSFGLLEYSLGNVIRALVTDSNRAAKDDPSDTGRYQRDLLCAVFALYDAEAPGKRRPDYPEQSPLQLVSQEGGRVPATSLYLGSGFGPFGEITQSLYGAWAPEKLVSAASLASLTNDTNKLADFLLWLGVVRWPRNANEEKPDIGYLDYTFRTINFPAAFADKVVSKRSEAYWASFEAVQSIGGLDDLLSNAEPVAVSAWLANDDRSLSWSRPARDHARLLAYPPGTKNPRAYGGAVPSYIRWRIESTSWLTSGDGAVVRPKDCVLGERAIEDLFPRPAMPDQEVLQRFEMQPLDMVEGWRRAGVLTSLAFLERDEIYAKLLELPDRSPDGRLARPLYHWLLDTNDSALGGEGPSRQEFITRGRMWGHHGKEAAYFPVSQMHHADTEGLPQELLDKLKIVDLRKRVGPMKVERLFGVKPVDQAGITRRIVAKDVAVGSSDANARFEEAKPYLHKLRVSQTSELAQLQRLKDLRLEVCSTLLVELAFEGEVLEYDLPVWGWMIEEKTLYVRSDPARPLAFRGSLFSNAICEGLAALFRLADGGDFARMLDCPAEDRSELLRKLRGDSILEDFDAIKEEYVAFSSRTLGVAGFPATPAPKLSELVTPVGGGSESLATPAPQPSAAPVQPNQPLAIVEEAHVPQPPGEQRKLQVRTVTSSTKPGTGSQRVTDGDFCERKAMEFEAACDPPRWPFAVGQIMGAEGPGCDILSFRTQEAREAFRQGINRELDTVARFIEVKGRGSAGATIELKGNELAAADRYKERYYLYRFFEAEDGTFELAMLDNPLAHPEALRSAVHVGMEQAKATQRFSLIGGLRKEQGQA
ncbi:DUF3883 domain-containing protein [Accumulibacter sp.]|uniref:DUF3883 domain-containing protein n=1 Tax=Accumulibacter sp. TaxID=2053492 RepID=UPI001AD1F1EA|nr:DUF3883 domain-containing protein [Accumulibacter sp.]MBN8514187.1 DUF3883 domain-containing protein [Accumulibacter sp.]MBO3701966.1 DUF3883 domain-containing protein [Accumulibacter sp.]